MRKDCRAPVRGDQLTIDSTLSGKKNGLGVPIVESGVTRISRVKFPGIYCEGTPQ